MNVNETNWKDTPYLVGISTLSLSMYFFGPLSVFTAEFPEPKCAWPRERLTSQSQNTLFNNAPLKKPSVYPNIISWSKGLSCPKPGILGCMYALCCMLVKFPNSFLPSECQRCVKWSVCKQGCSKKRNVIRACNHSMPLAFFEFTPLSLKIDFLLSIFFHSRQFDPLPEGWEQSI